MMYIRNNALVSLIHYSSFIPRFSTFGARVTRRALFPHHNLVVDVVDVDVDMIRDSSACVTRA